jgi:uncharacterized protein YjbI with pentapeptide repeats
MVNSKGTNQEATMKSTARLRVGVLLILIVVALASSLWAVWPWPTGDWKGLALNLGTEMAGAVVTYALLELFIGGRERREAKKADLIAQMGSGVKDVAIAAAEELRRRGWLTDGSLQGANLHEAELPEANLSEADLQRAHLEGANLNEADLQGAHLEGAFLREAKLREASLFRASLQRAHLEGANLSEADLRDADLRDADLRGAKLIWANLRGANLGEAELEGAYLGEAKCNDNTILPDGTKWTPDTDMARFTDSDHPDFWQRDA